MLIYLLSTFLPILICILYIIIKKRAQESSKRRVDVHLNIRSIYSGETIEIKQSINIQALPCIILCFLGVSLLLLSIVGLSKNSVMDLYLNTTEILLSLLMIGLPVPMLLKAIEYSGVIVLEKGTLTLTSLLKTQNILLSEIDDLFIFHRVYSTKLGPKEENILVVWLKSGAKLQKGIEDKRLYKCKELVKALYKISEDEIQVPHIVDYNK